MAELIPTSVAKLSQRILLQVASRELKEIAMDTKEKIRKTLVELLKLKPEELKDDVRLCDGIGVDSTEMVEFVIALEKTFAAKLSPKEITKSSTINDIEKIIQSKLK
jgi:acyl carrier protein